MGRGLVDWILVDHEKRREFYAVPHAVESLKTMDIQRSIFAQMKSPPLEALTSMDGGKKFNDVFFNHDISHADNNSVAGKFESAEVVTFTKRIEMVVSFWIKSDQICAILIRNCYIYIPLL